MLLFQMTTFKQIALIGSTASGKTALSIELAHQSNANILSLDSLALYKKIDIASAKPTIEERANIQHFGIDEYLPNEPFDVTTFIELYKKAKKESIQENKNLIIVGGTSFYLSSLLNGISQLPPISQNAKEKSNKLLKNVEMAHAFLNNLDPQHLSSINTKDRYRIEKMLNLYFETSLTPTMYFKNNPPRPIIKDKLDIYEIDVEREVLRERIKKRTKNMLHAGLIDEVFYLEKTYTRQPNCMKSIGIKEVLSYMDGHYNKEEMEQRIVIHTAQLAKRQRTFNRSQFTDKTLLPLEKLREKLLKNS
ncbi:MAG: tRNA dimethylallyltransferase (EC [uncultured Sulfurovum sp.]|uniref:tRNA dimethylallyltransferase n=1 Tax=uncultured Sulfurovum sp. TaxID=269237 RepID=A0A6S6TKW4_9BACT|nr:MAG: tRNA dimethylallyltransferase (EC [uncultured Sulfurovum sp.]